jgi:hypothetical protein
MVGLPALLQQAVQLQIDASGEFDVGLWISVLQAGDDAKFQGQIRAGEE